MAHGSKRTWGSTPCGKTKPVPPPVKPEPFEPSTAGQRYPTYYDTNETPSSEAHRITGRRAAKVAVQDTTVQKDASQSTKKTPNAI